MCHPLCKRSVLNCIERALVVYLNLKSKIKKTVLAENMNEIKGHLSVL